MIQRKRPAALPEIIRAAMPEARCWELKIDGETCRAIVNRENIAAERDVPDERWHVSVSNETHLPPWAVFAEVIHELRPGVPFCLPIPPKCRGGSTSTSSSCTPTRSRTRTSSRNGGSRVGANAQHERSATC